MWIGWTGLDPIPSDSSQAIRASISVFYSFETFKDCIDHSRPEISKVKRRCKLRQKSVQLGRHP